jgi:hypothetical protein
VTYGENLDGKQIEFPAGGLRQVSARVFASAKALEPQQNWMNRLKKGALRAFRPAEVAG